MAPSQPRFTRRSFLTGSAAVGVAAVAGGVGGVALASATESKVPTVVVPGYIPFDGAHQAGIVTPTRVQTAAIFVALDAVVASKAELTTALAELTRRARQETGGWAPEAGDPLYPPPESGIEGAAIGPSDLTITVGFGASLFDERFGLADQRPTQLTRMPSFPNDRLQPGLSHGDLMVQICATDETSCLHALRYLMAGTRGDLVVRWLIHGFQQRPGGSIDVGGTQATPRNLLGFKDGTANPKANDAGLMDDLVWVSGSQGEPSWSVRWQLHGGPAHPDVRRALGPDRPRRAGGDHRSDEADGRPAGHPPRGGGTVLRDRPGRVAYPARRTHPPGKPAYPRDGAESVLRRGYSYSRGFDGAGLLDEGLMFVCFQQDLERGFVTVQKRLAGEPLEEYIQGVGGGYFFAPPGTTPDEVIGGSLLA